MRYAEAIREHREAIDRVADGSALPKLKKIYDQAVSELERKLAGLVRARRGETMTAHQVRAMLLQAKDAQRRLQARMSAQLGEASRSAYRDSVAKLHRQVAKLDQRFAGAVTVLPIVQAGVFAGVRDERERSLIRLHQSSFERYGERLTKAIEGQLTMSLVTGETPYEATQRVVDTVHNRWWEADRIVRTELSWAANAGHYDGIRVAAKHNPGLMMRWVEHCTDDGAPLDDRVGVDSMAMHGQVAHPGGRFTMPDAAPDGAAVPDVLVGRSWMFPPDRPNDRAVLSPWRPRWGGRGWRLIGGERVPVGVDA